MFIYFNDRATTEFYTLSLHDALPIFESVGVDRAPQLARPGDYRVGVLDAHVSEPLGRDAPLAPLGVHLVEAADLVAAHAQQRVGSYLPGRHVLGLPAEQLSVEGLRVRRIGGREVRPAEGPRLVALPLSHPFLLL